MLFPAWNSLPPDVHMTALFSMCKGVTLHQAFLSPPCASRHLFCCLHRTHWLPHAQISSLDSGIWTVSFTALSSVPRTAPVHCRDSGIMCEVSVTRVVDGWAALALGSEKAHWVGCGHAQKCAGSLAGNCGGKEGPAAAQRLSSAPGIFPEHQGQLCLGFGHSLTRGPQESPCSSGLRTRFCHL